MEIKQWHLYKNRKGERVLIINDDNDVDFRFKGLNLDTRETAYYTRDGSYFNNTISNRDLVEEVCEIDLSDSGKKVESTTFNRDIVLCMSGVNYWLKHNQTIPKYWIKSLEDKPKQYTVQIEARSLTEAKDKLAKGDVTLKDISDVKEVK